MRYYSRLPALHAQQLALRLVAAALCVGVTCSKPPGEWLVSLEICIDGECMYLALGAGAPCFSGTYDSVGNCRKDEGPLLCQSACWVA